MAKVFSFNSKQNGSYIDSVSKTAGTNTAGVFKRTEKGLAWLGDGSSSKLDTNLPYANLDLTGDKTFIAWLKPYGRGEAGDAQILNDGKIYFGMYSANERVIFSSDTITYKSSAVTSAVSYRKWNFVVITRKSDGKVTFYINNIISGAADQDSGTPTAGTTDLIIGNYNGLGAAFEGLFGRVEIHDEIFTTNQRAKAYNEFLQASPKIVEKYPRYLPEHKSSDLSKEIGIAASYNFINTDGLYVDTSGEGFNITINKRISTLSGSKLSAAETIGNIGNIKSIAFRIKPDSTTEKLMEGAANDKLIHINAGTLTYPEFDLAYINGVIGTAMVADQWQTVVITSSTNVDFSACSLALNNITAGNFEIEDLRFFADEKSANWAAQYHNQSAKRIVLGSFPDNNSDAVGNHPVGVQKGSGTYVISEETSQDSVLKDIDIGTKVIECTGAGTIAIQNTNIPGEIEIDLYHKGALDTTIAFIAANSTYAVNGSYHILLASNHRVMLRIDSAGAWLFYSVVDYISTETWYRVKITRTLSGEFSIFIKGGAFGNKYVLVDATGGTGINPITDTTYTTTNYIICNFNVGDKIIIR